MKGGPAERDETLMLYWLTVKQEMATAAYWAQRRPHPREEHWDQTKQFLAPQHVLYDLGHNGRGYMDAPDRLVIHPDWQWAIRGEDSLALIMPLSSLFGDLARSLDAWVAQRREGTPAANKQLAGSVLRLADLAAATPDSVVIHLTEWVPGVQNVRFTFDATATSIEHFAPALVDQIAKGRNAAEIGRTLLAEIEDGAVTQERGADAIVALAVSLQRHATLHPDQLPRLREVVTDWARLVRFPPSNGGVVSGEAWARAAEQCGGIMQQMQPPPPAPRARFLGIF